MRISNRDEEYVRALGNVIYNVRQHKGLSQEELADKSGLHRTYISQVENGKNTSIDAFLHICQSLNVIPSDILKTAEKGLKYYESK